MGAPAGLWQVYHLTPVDDRMYVTILHFNSVEADGQPRSSAVVDSMMLYPGHWSVAQILSDNPGVASICSAGCEEVRTADKSGGVSFLLEPQQASGKDAVLYFVGDSAEITWKDVSSLQSVASWIYVLPRTDFEKSRTYLTRNVIGTWRPAAEISR
jgi:hypothetical protein